MGARQECLALSQRENSRAPEICEMLIDSVQNAELLIKLPERSSKINGIAADTMGKGEFFSYGDVETIETYLILEDISK